MTFLQYSRYSSSQRNFSPPQFCPLHVFYSSYSTNLPIGFFFIPLPQAFHPSIIFLKLLSLYILFKFPNHLNRLPLTYIKILYRTFIVSSIFSFLIYFLIYLLISSKNPSPQTFVFASYNNNNNNYARDGTLKTRVCQTKAGLTSSCQQIAINYHLIRLWWMSGQQAESPRRYRVPSSKLPL